jgi:lipoyl synthase
MKLPGASVEVLTPDFLGVEEDALRTVLAARPEVFNHNIETVRRLHRNMRGAKASYEKALWLLRRAKELADYSVLTKSGLIVGLGETNEEIVETMRDLRANGVDVVTIGQYLQPSPKHAAIDRWVHPDEFRWLREQGEALGFGSVFAGPLVRSSYRADEQRHAAETGRGAVAY